jgi:hypothetical protein
MGLGRGAPRVYNALPTAPASLQLGLQETLFLDVNMWLSHTWCVWSKNNGSQRTLFFDQTHHLQENHVFAYRNPARRN